ncbi:MAG TPA: cytochrome c peroxidase [Phycisphaerae bacterium]|nr:cytochrome c peroxidase [Phycisphaerae bacterium]
MAFVVATGCLLHAEISLAQPTGRTDSSLATLGQVLFFDTTLSNPSGQACASCHSAATGFRFPDSTVNQNFGVARGVIPDRFTNRAVPTIAYAAFVPDGPPFAHGLAGRQSVRGEAAFFGGLFLDGRAINLEDQARFPFLNPNEMNNLVNNMPSPALVVQELMNSPNADLFREVFGEDIFTHPTDEVYQDIATAIGAYERTPQVSPFTSKYDAYLIGMATLTPEEFDGLCLMTGSATGIPGGPPHRKDAQCIACHGIPSFPTDGPFLFTDFSYANIGVPKNANNPFYTMTDPKTNPVGYNPLGANFIDLGLGDFLYPLNDLPPGNMGPGSSGDGDFLGINGTFRVPTLRNIDKRPSPDFVKAYMHNGGFKSLKDIVHFYNTRNLTTEPGEVINFYDEDPYANLIGQPLWPPPEISSPDSIENPDGASSEDGGQVGNLGLTDEEEDHIVAFLKTLSDGTFENEPVVFSSGPANAVTCPGGTAVFHVNVSGTPTFFYQWYRGTDYLADGGSITGSQTATLTIHPAGPGDVSSEYHCEVRNVLGPVTSPSASLILVAAGSGDGTGDGQLDGRDIRGFVQSLLSGVPGIDSCVYDMNSNGSVGIEDVGLFTSALLGSP